MHAQPGAKARSRMWTVTALGAVAALVAGCGAVRVPSCPSPSVYRGLANSAPGTEACTMNSPNICGTPTPVNGTSKPVPPMGECFEYCPSPPMSNASGTVPSEPQSCGGPVCCNDGVMPK